MFTNDLRQLISYNEDQYWVDWAIPVWNADDCVWEIDTIAGTWAVTCSEIQTCMDPIVNSLDGRISNNQTDISNMNTRISNLEALPHHEHANMSALNNVTDVGGWQNFLADDWSYKPLPRVSYYQQVRSNWNYVVERSTLNFDSIFTVTDDATNWYTTIGIDPAMLWGGGWVADGNNYVVSGIYNDGTKTLSLSRLGLSDVNIDMSSLSTENNYVTWWTYNQATETITLTRQWLPDVDIDVSSMDTVDELVKVWSTGVARHLNTDDFVDNGTDIEVKKQMSIVSDSAWLKLDGDELIPWPNMLYGTDDGGVKTWVPNNDAGQLEYSVTLQNTLTVNHNLGKFPSVLCIDSSGKEIIADVTYNDNNSFVVDWLPAFTGTVYLT